jgi:hypothetical protein
MHQVLVGLPTGDGGLASLFNLNFVYFNNTHRVLVGLPQGHGGLVLLFRFISFNLFYILF